MNSTLPEAFADSLYVVGRVIRPHGVKGEIKVVPETEAPERWDKVERIFIGPTVARSREYTVQSIRYQQTKRGMLILVKLAEISGRDEALQLLKQQVAVHGDDLPPLEEGEVFIHELMGVTVKLRDETPVGIVVDVIQQPAHDVLVIERESGNEVMVPAIETFVDQVDLAEGIITILPIEGMLD